MLVQVVELSLIACKEINNNVTLTDTLLAIEYKCYPSNLPKVTYHSAGRVWA